MQVLVTRTKRARYEAKHIIYDIRNGHIEVEEEIDTAAAHDLSRRKAFHGV